LSRDAKEQATKQHTQHRFKQGKKTFDGLSCFDFRPVVKQRRKKTKREKREREKKGEKKKREKKGEKKKKKKEREREREREKEREKEKRNCRCLLNSVNNKFARGSLIIRSLKTSV